MSWVEKPLGDVVSVVRKINSGKAMPYVGMEHISSGTGEFLGQEDPVTVKSNTFIFEPGHVLYGRLRPYLNKVLMPEFKGHCSTEVFPLKPNNEVDKRFLFYWITSEPVVNRINETCTGARMPRANVDEILTFEFPHPPLPEQQRIVVKLDAAFAALGEAQGLVERNRANARELFESYLNGVFERKGDGWVECTLPDISENLDSRRVPITKSDRKAGEYPYYGASGIVDYVHEYIFDEDCLLISEDGANLLMRSTPIAFSVSGKYWVNNHAHILRFKDMATQRLVEYYFASIALDPWITGAAQPKLNQGALNSIPVHLPEKLKEREQLVADLDSLQEETEQLESTYAQKLLELDALKKGLLGAAFRGEL